MVDFHKKEVIHLHTQLRNKYEYFRKANPQIVSRDNDPETLRMELEATKNSLLAQQKIFGKIVGSGSVEEKNTVNVLSVSSTLPIRGSTQSISNSQISSISLSNSSVTESGLRKAQSGQKELTASMFVQKTEDVLNLKKQLNDRDQEISELKRLIREHLTISSQHINPDAE
jgi:DNA primase large subunit